jgi:2-polyprenyl-6-methoxyphenol hydroxylase-like FAD-dependent oxidoreductase
MTWVCLTCLVVVSGCSAALSFLVVGGGPVGLSSALAIREACPECNVTVWERRTRYTRNIWFDLAPGPFWGVAADWVRQRCPLLPLVVSSDDAIATVRCQVLEAHLLQACEDRGVVVERGTTWREVADSASFDVLIGADGPRSRVREQTGMAQVHESPWMQQSVIVDFVESQCPSKRANVSVALPAPGAVFAFRRFFDSDARFCSMQVLLRANVTHTSVPRDLVARVAEAVLSNFTLASIAQVRLISFRVRHATVGTALVSGGKQVGVLVGDALVGAHYRLGIGVNAALASLGNLQLFVTRLVSSDRSEWTAIVREKNAADVRRVAAVVAFQELVIYLEGHCGYVLAFQPPSDALTENDNEFFDDGEQASYSDVYFLPRMQVYEEGEDGEAMTVQEAKSKCTVKYL